MPLPRSLAGNLREEVDGSSALGRGAHHGEEVQDAERAKAEQSGREMSKEAGRSVPSAEDRPLPHRAVSQVVDEPRGSVAACMQGCRFYPIQQSATH
jgi:hypothetical protein